MLFVKLSRIPAAYAASEVTYYNLDLVETLVPMPNGSAVHLCGRVEFVAETPEQILKLCEAAVAQRAGPAGARVTELMNSMLERVKPR